MKRAFISAIAASSLFWAFPAIGAETVKFGKTCIGNSGSTRDICLSFNGKTISSWYKYRASVPTTGTHTGCDVKGSTLTCSGGSWRTARGSGKMNPVTVKLSNGKPVSISWR